MAMRRSASRPKSGPGPVQVLSVTPARTGARTMLGVENMLGSLAVPEPFSLELAGDADGVGCRCAAETVRW